MRLASRIGQPHRLPSRISNAIFDPNDHVCHAGGRPLVGGDGVLVGRRRRLDLHQQPARFVTDHCVVVLW